MALFEIKHRISGAVLFSLECKSFKICVQAAVEARANLAGANLAGAYLADANLARANLAGAYLARANLAGANLAGANLADAYLAGADLADANLARADLAGAVKIPPVSKEQSIKNLDVVGEIILENAARLEMGHWHGNGGWRDRTCAEEAVCGTTHCLAGWLQVCSTDPEIKNLDPYIAGCILAPQASRLFYRGKDEVLRFLKEREYANA